MVAQRRDRTERTRRAHGLDGPGSSPPESPGAGDRVSAGEHDPDVRPSPAAASGRRDRFLWWLGAIVLGGAAIRLWQLGQQIIGDDEWHAVNIAVHRPLGYILTHFHEADNCIPLTAYL